MPLSKKAHFSQVCLFLRKYVMHNYFCRLTNLPPLPRMYTKIASVSSYKWPEEHGKPNQITFSYCPEFEATQFCQKLKRDFGIVVVMLFRNEPSSFYNWHSDLGEPEYGPRSCCINFPLSDNPGAVTMFKDHSFNEVNFGVKFCEYKLLHPTLFNTQISHAVLNASAAPRYVLSVGFFKPYDEVKEYLQKLSFSTYNDLDI